LKNNFISQLRIAAIDRAQEKDLVEAKLHRKQREDEKANGQEISNEEFVTGAYK
jgi:hypothetical protein